MKRINLIGLGTGSRNFLTNEAETALSESEIVFGAKRILEIAKKACASSFPQSEALYNAGEIFAYLQKNPQYQKISVVFGGLGIF